MSKDIDVDRRRFFGTAAVTIAAAHFSMLDSADAQSSKVDAADVPRVKRRTNTSFGPLKQIDAGVLNIGYAGAGPSGGPAVILLHGWPYDIQSFVDVAPLLESRGYRVIVDHGRPRGPSQTNSHQRPAIYGMTILGRWHSADQSRVERHLRVEKLRDRASEVPGRRASG